MDKNILFKSLLQGIAGMIILALLCSIVKDDSFLELLVEPETILIGISAVIGSYIGYQRKAKKEAKNIC